MNNLMNIINKLLTEMPVSTDAGTGGNPERQLSKVGASKVNLLTQLEDAIKTTTERIRIYQDAIIKLQEEMSKKIASLDTDQAATIGGYQGTIETLQREVSELTNRVSELHADIIKYKNETAKLKNIIIRLSNSLNPKDTENAADIENVTISLEDLEKKVEDYHKTAVELKKRASDLTSSVTTAQTKTKRAYIRGAKDLKSAWDEAREINKVYNQIYDKAEEYEKEIKNLRTAIEELMKRTSDDTPIVSSTLHYGKLNLMEHLKRAEKIDKKRNKK